ncbi:MAG: ATP-binding cassette domain-containing protein, partial [Ilumatobacter sp.]|uniref:ATP-binding cassette domain-containing protein n=1 Tax=Ilumatobacter sp. TaxID=1967498 RepID=UPI003C7834D4
TLSASANLLLARPEGRLRPGRSRTGHRLAALIERYGLPVRDGVPASSLSVGEQQRLELLRALDADAEILVLDEPTAVLTDAEADRLLSVCRRLADEGRAVAIITHRLGEVIAGCDRVTVLRNGKTVLADGSVDEHDRRGLATAMIGSESTGRFTERGHPTTPAPTTTESVATLNVRGVSWGRLHDVTFEVARGEVLGVAGIDGNGQAELEAVLAGRVAPDDGAVAVDEVGVVGGDPQARRAAGVAYIPSDRYRHGLVRAMTLSDNLELGRVPRLRPTRRQRHADAEPTLEDWSVLSAGPGATASSLSGGNAQKVVLARELGGSPAVVLACYPTRGLDPGAASTVADRIVTRASNGAAVLWIGAELDELFAVSDRILVLADGRITGEFTAPFDRERIGLAMTDTSDRERVDS